MALTRTHCSAAVGRAGGPNPNSQILGDGESGHGAAAATSSPAKCRRRRSERGPHREPVNVELPRSEAVQAESSVESLGDALEPLEARYLTQCRARLLGPVRMVYPSGRLTRTCRRIRCREIGGIGREELRRVDDVSLEDAVCGEILKCLCEFAERRQALRTSRRRETPRPSGNSQSGHCAYASTKPGMGSLCQRGGAPRSEKNLMPGRPGPALF